MEGRLSLFAGKFILRMELSVSPWEITASP
jgi:hypothetical protein